MATTDSFLRKQLETCTTGQELIDVFKLVQQSLYMQRWEKNDLISLAKNAKAQHESIWTVEVRQSFGRCLKAFDSAQNIFILRQRKDEYDTGLNAVELFIKFTLSTFDPLINKLPIRKLSIGGSHVMALAIDGTIYVKGSNDFGQLGISGIESTRIFIPLNIPQIHDIAAGFSFSMAITTDGELYGWGCSEEGRIATQAQDNVLEPIRIDCSVKFQSITAGSMHGHGISKDGILYGWGPLRCIGTTTSLHKRESNMVSLNDYTEMEWIEYASAPVIVDGLRNEKFYSVSIGNGGYHTVAVTVDGKMFAWGHNRVGQVTSVDKNDSDSSYLKVPQKVRDDIAWATAGWGHTVFTTSSGFVYGTGRNCCQQLGNPSTEPKINRGHPFYDTPQRLPFPESGELISSICTRYGTYVVVQVSGEKKMFQWGKPERYQI